MTTSSTDTNAGPPGAPSPRSRWPWLIVLLAGLTAGGVWQVWPALRARRLAQAYVFADKLSEDERAALKTQLIALDNTLVERSRVAILSADEGINGDRLPRIGDLPGLDAYPATRAHYRRLMLDRSRDFDTRFVAMGLFQYNCVGPVPAEPLKSIVTERPTTELSLHALVHLAGAHGAEAFLRSLVADSGMPGRLRAKALELWANDSFGFHAEMAESLPAGLALEDFRRYELAKSEVLLGVPGAPDAPGSRGATVEALTRVLRPVFEAEITRLEAGTHDVDSQPLIAVLINMAELRPQRFRAEMTRLLSIRPVSKILPALRVMGRPGATWTGLEEPLLAIVRTDEPGWTLDAAAAASDLLGGTRARPAELRAAIEARRPSNEALRPLAEPGYGVQGELLAEREIVALLKRSVYPLEPHAEDVYRLLNSREAEIRFSGLELVPFLRRPSKAILRRARELSEDPESSTRFWAEECLERVNAWRPLVGLLAALRAGNDDLGAARDLIAFVSRHDDFEHLSQPLATFQQLLRHSDSRLNRRLRRDLRWFILSGCEVGGMQNTFLRSQQLRNILGEAERLTSTPKVAEDAQR